MGFQNTVVALLVVIVLTLVFHELRADHRASADRIQEQQSLPDVRVARVSKAALSEVVDQPRRVAELIGLQPSSRPSHRSLNALRKLTETDASHAVFHVIERGRDVQLVVLVE